MILYSFQIAFLKAPKNFIELCLLKAWSLHLKDCILLHLSNWEFILADFWLSHFYLTLDLDIHSLSLFS